MAKPDRVVAKLISGIPRATLGDPGKQKAGKNVANSNISIASSHGPQNPVWPPKLDFGHEAVRGQTVFVRAGAFLQALGLVRGVFLAGLCEPEGPQEAYCRVCFGRGGTHAVSRDRVS